MAKSFTLFFAFIASANLLNHGAKINGFPARKTG